MQGNFWTMPRKRLPHSLWQSDDDDDDDDGGDGHSTWTTGQQLKNTLMMSMIQELLNQPIILHSELLRFVMNIQHPKHLQPELVTGQDQGTTVGST